MFMMKMLDNDNELVFTWGVSKNPTWPSERNYYSDGADIWYMCQPGVFGGKEELVYVQQTYEPTYASTYTPPSTLKDFDGDASQIDKSLQDFLDSGKVLHWQKSANVNANMNDCKFDWTLTEIPNV